MLKNCKLVPISVNFSRVHLFDRNFVEKLVEISTSYGVPANLLEIELTETMVLSSRDLLFETVERLHKAGFTVSVDDFGSGYSSLMLLNNALFDVIKLDRGFLNRRLDGAGEYLIQHIIELVKNLNMKIIAEGVETIEEIEFLKASGCDAVQGYYFSRPIPIEEFIKKYLL